MSSSVGPGKPDPGYVLATDLVLFKTFSSDRDEGISPPRFAGDTKLGGADNSLKEKNKTTLIVESQAVIF